ncbi:MAG: NUMOD4 domain-containing protein [Clostridia bacterium]|nr:NUMOD4 domain-containing protein [Clostridia bacterium]
MEIWKDVPGYEGLYEVCSIGRVRRLDGKRWNGRSMAKLKGGILKQNQTRGGYLFVGLSKDGAVKQFRINRLVALAFIPNPDNLPFVGHWDDNRLNNTVENLYWTTPQENCTHNGAHLRTAEKCCKPIIGQSGGITIRFKSSVDAGKNGFNSSAIRNCLTGRTKTHKGYEWKYT